MLICFSFLGMLWHISLLNSPTLLTSFTLHTFAVQRMYSNLSFLPPPNRILKDLLLFCLLHSQLIIIIFSYKLLHILKQSLPFSLTPGTFHTYISLHSNLLELLSLHFGRNFPNDLSGLPKLCFTMHPSTSSLQASVWCAPTLELSPFALLYSALSFGSFFF